MWLLVEAAGWQLSVLQLQKLHESHTSETCRYNKECSCFDKIIIRVCYFSTFFLILLNVLFFLFFSDITNIFLCAQVFCAKASFLGSKKEA